MLGAHFTASIVDRWFGAVGDDPLLVLQRASGERPEAAEALASFLEATPCGHCTDTCARAA
ncbi:hypothetical protein ACNTMW_18040 [Planosporangium sp. 12N6]|uniref:hypothetical protein n=1 Tax=Planosporangium spinosum TaxID=3402278 RepID=UPI003CF19756